MELFKKIWQKFLGLFKQGLSPKELAQSLIISILVTLFPAFGITTTALTFIAIPARLNLPVMITISYILEPLKYLLIIPFIHFGSSILGMEHSLLTFEAIKSSFELNFWFTLKDLSFELICGIVGWAIITLPLGLFSYLLLKVFLIGLIKPKTNPLVSNENNGSLNSTGIKNPSTNRFA